MDLLCSVASAPVDRGPRPLAARGRPLPQRPVSLLFWAITIVVLGIAVRETNRRSTSSSVPLMGVMAAFIFAAQMFNFQVAGGTSGHLLGGVLAAILLGPWAGHPRDGLRDRRPGPRVLRRRARRDGRQHLQHGHRRHARRLLALPRPVPALLGGEDRARVPAAAIAGWLSVMLAAVCDVARCSPSSGTSPARGRAAGDARRPRAHRRRRGADHGRGAWRSSPATRPDLLDLRPDRAARAAAGGSPASRSDDRPRRVGRPDVRSTDPATHGRPAARPVGRWWWLVGLAIAALVVVVLAPARLVRPGRPRAGRGGRRLHRAGAELLRRPARRLRDPGRRQRLACRRCCPACSASAILVVVVVPGRSRPRPPAA